MQYLVVKNWREFQHYKDRNPPWIKLHRAIVDDYAFASLKDKTKAHLMLIWILAAGTEGRIPNDPAFIASRIGAREAVALEDLVAAGFLLPEDGAAFEPLATLPETPKRANGHALDLAALPEDWRAFCAAERPRLDADKTFFQFRDHWLANANQARGRKADWFAAWRTWIRRERQ
jgi:hypothetical protein